MILLVYAFIKLKTGLIWNMLQDQCTTRAWAKARADSNASLLFISLTSYPSFDTSFSSAVLSSINTNSKCSVTRGVAGERAGALVKALRRSLSAVEHLVKPEKAPHFHLTAGHLLDCSILRGRDASVLSPLGHQVAVKRPVHLPPRC